MNLTPKDIFDKHSSVYIPEMIPKEFTYFFTHVLLNYEAKGQGKDGDSQVPNALCIIEHEHMFDTLLERLWPTIEDIVQEPLIPTYAYARLYSNGDTLEKHVDRESCEISVTLQLGRSHHYSWPIYMNGHPYYLAEGDAVVYKGCDADHWRDKCDGPPGYYSGQVFLHYVRQNGPYAEWGGDKRWPLNNLPFNRLRTLLMESK